MRGKKRMYSIRNSFQDIGTARPSIYTSLTTMNGKCMASEVAQSHENAQTRHRLQGAREAQIKEL